MKRALLDTSFVISLARGEELVLEDPPQEAAISAVTLCGLHHGVLVATDRQRPGRLATLIFAERRFAALPVDTRIAPHYGRLLADVRRRRGGKKLHTADALIAATAAAHGLPLITRDRDFAKLDSIDAIIV
ncbi:MAG TPA: PIN domain-containing protein [Solirubrobacteraceae bacterium]